LKKSDDTDDGCCFEEKGQGSAIKSKADQGNENQNAHHMLTKTSTAKTMTRRSTVMKRTSTVTTTMTMMTTTNVAPTPAGLPDLAPTPSSSLQRR
jgi:hypothetical protein